MGPSICLDRYRKFRHPTGIGSPVRPAFSELLYRLRYYVSVVLHKWEILCSNSGSDKVQSDGCYSNLTVVPLNKFQDNIFFSKSSQDDFFLYPFKSVTQQSAYILMLFTKPNPLISSLIKQEIKLNSRRRKHSPEQRDKKFPADPAACDGTHRSGGGGWGRESTKC